MGQFNHHLRDALTRLDINQTQLAERVNKKPSQVSRWLSSATLPDADGLISILAAFPAAEQSALTAAYIADLLPATAAHLVTILPVHGATIAEQPPERTWPEGLSEETRRKLVRFAALLRDYPEIEAIIDELLSLSAKLK